MFSRRSLLGSAAMALGMMAVAAPSASGSPGNHRSSVQPANHRPTRSWFWKGGQRKVSYPGQTDAQRDYMLAKAEAKRARRAINCTYNAKRSAEGYAHSAGRVYA